MEENETNGEPGPCPSCGAPGVGGLEGCLTAFGVLGEREFSHPEFYRVHRLTVDAYCLQHPERYMVSRKSAAAHLAATCWSLEIGLSRHMPAPLKRWLDGPKRPTRVTPPPPRERGRMTIADMLGVELIADYEAKAWQWARSAWDAWSDHWDQARSWVREAQGGP